MEMMETHSKNSSHLSIPFSCRAGNWAERRSGFWLGMSLVGNHICTINLIRSCEVKSSFTLSFSLGMCWLDGQTGDVRGCWEKGIYSLGKASAYIFGD